MRKLLIVLIMTAACTTSVGREDDDVSRVFFFFWDKGVDISHSINYFLYQEIFSWYKTPYKYSGESEKGIDCSGFVSMLYHKIFHRMLSGGSADILKNCVEVDRDDLCEGDLLFFKIRGGVVSHVGIYLMNGKFAHATTQAGVIVSDLKEAYYQRTFYKAGRLNE